MPKRLGTTGLEALEPLGAFVHAFFHKNICLILLWHALSQALRTNCDEQNGHSACLRAAYSPRGGQ